MVDPITLGTTLISSALVAGGTAAANSLMQKDMTAPAAPSAPKPMADPGKKPQTPGMQQSFLSGVAGSMLPGSQAASGNPVGGAQTGKTLLGA